MTELYLYTLFVELEFFSDLVDLSDFLSQLGKSLLLRLMFYERALKQILTESFLCQSTALVCNVPVNIYVSESS